MVPFSHFGRAHPVRITELRTLDWVCAGQKWTDSGSVEAEFETPQPHAAMMNRRSALICPLYPHTLDLNPYETTASL